MDRQSVIGLFLIGLILIGFSIFNAPSEEELAEMRRQQDSLALAEEKALQQDVLAKKQQSSQAVTPDALPVVDSLTTDSARNAYFTDAYGLFAQAAAGKEDLITIENEVMKIEFTTRGGRVRAVELKRYKSWDSTPVRLFESDSTRFNLNFFSRNRSISTGDLYFKPGSSSSVVRKGDSLAFTMRLEAGSPGRYIEYRYLIRDDDYRIGFDLNMVGMDEVIAANTGYVELDWSQRLRQQEKDLTVERANSTIYYRHADEDSEVDYLSETSDEKEEIKTRLKWVAMKQQFFTQALVAADKFDKPTRIETVAGVEGDEFVEQMHATFTIPFNHRKAETFPMYFYFGPNHYQLLKEAGDQLEKQIPLGWGIFGWVNRFIVIPIFNYLNSFDWSYGIIILILTIAIKLMLLPLTFKAYLSQAKMKVLRPEMEEIQTKFKEEPMKLQQEMFGLYRKAGVSPLGGCLPMLLQLPILIAMFRFFPQSIELRQESFLWAKDLSTYDSILDLPFYIWGYGDHVSLFTLLMTVSTLLITMVNSQSTMTNPQMKWMMYLMPIVFLGVFNNYSSGLSYYYFLANMISIGQQFLFKSFVNDEEIHRKIQENKKRPVSQTKSKFQQRLEKMAKERGYKLPK